MSSVNNIVLMDQYTSSDQSGTEDLLASGLAHAGLAPESSGTASPSADDARTVKLIEMPVTGLLMLRAAKDADVLSDALMKQCGVPLTKRLQSSTQGQYCIRWMSPDAWLLSCPLQEVYAIEKAVRETVSGHIAIVPVSGGYSVLELTGANARHVLMKSTSYDVHPDHFTAGKVVNTVFAKAQMTLRAIESSDTDARYELIVRRSFSDYVWLWIQQAALEYGLVAVRSRE